MHVGRVQLSSADGNDALQQRLHVIAGLAKTLVDRIGFAVRLVEPFPGAGSLEGSWRDEFSPDRPTLRRP
jgi:hypothetical protein